jgi:hypothetical protein
MFILIILFTLIIQPVLAAPGDTVDASSLNKKYLFGYQG